MEGGTFLTRVVLENYKSIAHCDVALGPLTYLVGPNGAGKSNFLDGLHFVADALQHSVGHALRSRGGGVSICHAANKHQRCFGIHLEFTFPDGKSGHYTMKLGQPRGPSFGSWEVVHESIGLPIPRGKTDAAPQDQTRRPVFGDQLALAHLADQPAYRDVHTALTRMLFYNIKPRSIEDVSTFEPGQFLLPDGSNLAGVFASLALSGETARDRINEYIRLILPTLIQVRTEPVLPETPDRPIDAVKVALLFSQRILKGVHLFWPSQMSEGTLRSLGILTALLQGTASALPRPSLVAVEEPEVQVHPAVLGVLRDAMVEASFSTQVLVTTESADLLDNKDVLTDTLLAVTADEGGTRIAPIDSSGRDMIRQQLYTPGELLRIGQLFPEPGQNGSASERPAVVGETL